MEKIQQAIERARQQRAGLTGQGMRNGAIATAHRPAAIETLVDNAEIVALDPRHLRDTRIVCASSGDPRADAFRTLRTQTLMRLNAVKGRSVAVVSARDGEGKTLVACNLALSLARQSEGPVFLVDMDFRRPAVHRTLGLKPRGGIADVIEGRLSLEDIILRCEDSNLYILPQPSAMQHASELIASTRAREFVQRLQPGYVVVDCPPLLLTDEPLTVQGFVDGCLLVVQQGRTSRDEVQRASELLDETKYLGSVINRAGTGGTKPYYGYR